MPEFTRRDLLRSGVALSATAVVSGVTLARAGALLAGGNAIASSKGFAAVAPREQLLFDFGWKFMMGSGSDPLRDLGFGKGQDDFSKTGSCGFATAKFDDSRWRSLNLPHDWAIELPFFHDEGLQSHGYKPLGRKYPREDIAIVRVEVLDSAGRHVPTADNLISFKIGGTGTFLGVGNGDPNCQESDKDRKRSLFSGLAQLIVQSTKTSGVITVEAYTEEWPGPKLTVAQLSIRTKKIEPRPVVPA